MRTQEVFMGWWGFWQGLENGVWFGEEGRRDFGNGVSKTPETRKGDVVSKVDRSESPQLERQVGVRLDIIWRCWSWGMKPNHNSHLSRWIWQQYVVERDSWQRDYCCNSSLRLQNQSWNRMPFYKKIQRFREWRCLANVKYRAMVGPECKLGPLPNSILSLNNEFLGGFIPLEGFM